MHSSPSKPSPPPRPARLRTAQGRRSPSTSVALVALGGLVLSSACGPAETTDPNAFTGVAQSGEVRMPDMHFPSMDGGDYDLRAETEGKVALLFIGFTNCPDICPVHLANLSAVLGDLSLEISRDIVTIFVTADPARDTPERLQEWLGAIDDDFIGLQPTREQVNALEDALQIVRSVVSPDEPTGYFVGHAAQIIAFDRQGVARAAFPWGVRQRDWRFDLPRMVAGDWPEPMVQEGG